MDVFEKGRHIVLPSDCLFSESSGHDATIVAFFMEFFDHVLSLGRSDTP